MEIGPILRALWNSKTRFWLITVEVALTLAIVVNCVNIILHSRREFLRPTGLDERHLLVVTTQPFGQSFQVPGFVATVADEDLLRLRAHPGVHDATAIDFVPLGGGGSIDSRTPISSDANRSPAPSFIVADHALQTLGVELVAGRDFEPEDYLGLVGKGDLDEPRHVIVTQALADRLFPDGDAVGKAVISDEGSTTDTIVGVVRRMHNAWPRASVGELTMLRPGRPGDSRIMRYLVRAEKEAVETLYQDLEQLMLDVNAERIVHVRTLTEYKVRYYDDSLMLVKVLTGVSVLLVAVTSLGIAGLTSFSVTQRVRQIGTRRALGATRSDVVRYFLVENWLVTSSGITLGAGLTVLLNVALASLAEAPQMNWTLLLAGTVLLWATGLAAALAPAYRATLVTPEVATRTV